MPAGAPLVDFKANLTHTRSNLRDLRGEVGNLETLVNGAQQALQTPARIESQATEFISTVRSMKFSLKVLEKVGPLKIVAKAVNNVLDELEDVAVRIRTKASDLDDRIERSGWPDRLDRAEDRLEEAQDEIRGVEVQVLQYEGNAQSLINAYNMDIPFDPLAPASDATDAAVTPLNTILTDLNAIYDGIEANVDDFRDALTSSLFAPILRVANQFNDINSSLRFLSGPLNKAYSLLSPLEPVLDAVGFIYSITVGPVVDWLLDNLGITALFDRIADEISGFLPSPDVLNGLEDRIDGAFVEVDAFLGELGWNTDIADFVDGLTDDIIAALGLDGDEVLRNGTEGDDTIVGRDGVDDILDGLGGDDQVSGLGGNDIFLESEGSDTLFGGDGDDRLILKGQVFDYVFYSEDETGAPVRFTDTTGRYGDEIAHDIENFTFAGGATFTRTELLQNFHPVGSTPFTSTGDVDEYIYAAGPGPVEINAGGGDDWLVGSDGADTLNGEAGDDVFVSRRGADLVNGGSGIDTWLFPKNDESGNPTIEVDLERGIAWDGDARDTLSGIENVSVRDSRETELFGDDGANVLDTNLNSSGDSGGANDWLDGRGGNDTLLGGGGRDLLIGGEGIDSVSGGAGSDVLVAGGVPVSGGGETYDGGEGFDRLIYSTMFREYDIEPESGDRLPDMPGSPSLRIFAETGRIERLDADGRGVATDRATGIESYIGGDSDDTVTGAFAEPGGRLFVDGGGGNDIVYSNGATETRGGPGDDRLIVTEGGASFDGGFGDDTLETAALDARWSIRLSGAIGTRIEAYRADEALGLGAEEESGGDRFSRIISGNLRNTEVIVLDRHADEVFLEGNERVTVFGGDGNDRLIRSSSIDGSSSAVLHGQNGDDYLRLNIEGEIYGGAGDDRLEVNASGDGHIADGGAGDDMFVVRRMDGELRGGDGYDIVTFNITSRVTRLELDLETGLLETPGDINSIDAMLSGFEEVIGDDGQTDRIFGSSRDERLIGRGGNDSLDGRGGRDELFGGDGNDSLSGGEGDDLLHGGAGRDTLEGGEGRDTASYANAVPSLADGAIAAGEFGGVTVDLGDGSAIGSAGSDLLRGIENVVGSTGDDALRGDDMGNVLSGGAGNDTLEGLGGDDVLILGPGDDVADGGDGDDNIVIDIGNATIDGGRGFDTLDLGNLDGAIDLDLEGGTYTATVSVEIPVWADTGGGEARIFDGAAMTPQDVLEAQSLHANDISDTSRTLPAEGDAEFPRFELRFTPESRTYSGTFTDIEGVVGGLTADRMTGRSIADTLSGGEGDDRLLGEAGADEIRGGDGLDTLNGGDGDDLIIGGETEDDRRDVIYAGAGDDSVDAGYGNDQVFGMAGNDTIAGGFGADNLQGQDGDDVITGSAFGDQVFGGAGNDFVNGGFGHDLINGGAGADRFFHLGVAGHGSDWVQDFDSAEGDTLAFGRAGSVADFQVNYAHTANRAGERSGEDAVQEAFVIYKPTGQILWALVDGAGQSSLNIQIGSETFDLLA